MKITICGSIAFYKEMELVRDQLEKIGHKVKIPELALEVPEEFGGVKKFILDNILKTMVVSTLLMLHMKSGI